jgi:AsmA protein
MKRLFSLLGLIAIAAVGTFFLIPYIVSAQTIRESVAAQLENLTGREVAVTGPASLSVFPNITVRIGGVSIANAEGMDPEPFVVMDELDASVRVMPLLRGQVEIERFVLVRPRFNFIVNATGRPNWRLSSAIAKSEETAADGASLSAGRPVLIGTFLILDGQIKFRNQRSGAAIDTSSINATVTWPSLASPMTASGNLVWRGEVLNFKTSSDDPIRLASGGTTRAAVMIDSNRFTVDVKGQFSTTVDFAVDGEINLGVPSVRALARWLGTNLPEGSGLNKLSLASKIILGGTKLAFSEATLGLDGNSAEGAIVVKLEGERPQLQATLATPTLNLNPYLPANAAASKGEAPKPGASSWSTETMDLSALKVINADLRLSAGKITARNYDLDSGAITAALTDGRLTAQVAELKAYGGQINGTLGIDSSAEVPELSTNFSAQGMTLLRLLTDVAGFSHVEGTADISGKLQSSGRSASDLIADLSGQLTVTAANGAIKGMDVGGLVQAARGNPLEGWMTTAGVDTKFDSLQANFDVNHGVAENKDFLLKGPGFEIAGSGRVDLPARSLDYRLSADLVSQPGNAANPVQAAVELPLIVRGEWNSPNISLDQVKLNSLAPQVKETINKVKEAVTKGALDLLGDASRQSDPNAVPDSAAITQTR